MSDEITKNWLFRKYIEEDKTQKEVSNLTNYSRSEIGRKIRKFNIDKKKHRKYTDSSWLNEKYNEDGLTQKEISDIANVDESVISKHIQKNGLVRGEKEICLFCEDKYYNLSRHWASSPSHRPEYSEKQKEIMIGILMSDGWVSERVGGRKSRFQCEMVEKEYIKYLKEVFGVLCNEITEINKETDQDIYRLSWKPHSFIDELSQWYSTGEKIWPEIEITPTILKHYYVGDGHLFERGGEDVNSRVELSMANESGNLEKVKRIFSPFTDDDFSVYKGQYGNEKGSLELNFTVEGTEKFFKYIGEEEVDGFEYKWRD
jgi:hypothetical protein